MNFLNMSFQVGRLFGIDIRIHILFLVLMAFRLFDAGTGVWYELGFWTMLFGIILLHEFGHCFGARSVGGDASQIILWPLGGLAFAHAPMTPWAQFVTVAAGPAVNLVFCLIAAGILIAGSGSVEIVGINPLSRAVYFEHWLDAPQWAAYMAMFYRVNLFLLAFNLLPIYPMDGGQLFQVMLWPALGVHRSTEIACQVGLAGSVLLGLWGLQTGGMLLFIAIFGGFTCYQRLQMLKYGMLIDERARYAPVKTYNLRKKSLWQRLFGGGGRAAEVEDDEPYNPNPGGWEKRLDEKRSKQDEVDRILAKVSKSGINSLSYVEQQTLKQASEEEKRRRG